MFNFSLFSEKDRYEESIRQMVDEAEQQLFISTDKIKKAV